MLVMQYFVVNIQRFKTNRSSSCHPYCVPVSLPWREGSITIDRLSLSPWANQSLHVDSLADVNRAQDRAQPGGRTSVESSGQGATAE